MPVKEQTSASKQITVPPGKTARVIFYRNKQFYAMLRACPVSINGQEPIDLNNGSVVTVDLAPGEYTFTHELWDLPGKYRIKVLLDGGTIYPVKLDPKSSVGTAGILGGYAGVLVNSAIEEQGGLCAILPESQYTASDNLNKLGYKISTQIQQDKIQKTTYKLPAETSTIAQPNDHAERLKTLKTLLSDGLITQDDYEKKKDEILNNL